MFQYQWTGVSSLVVQRNQRGNLCVGRLRYKKGLTFQLLFILKHHYCGKHLPDYGVLMKSLMVSEIPLQISCTQSSSLGSDVSKDR